MKNIRCLLLCIFIIITVFRQGYVYAQTTQSLLKTENIRIRDPFIYADPDRKIYYLYAQSANRAGSNFTGVEAYTSTDLKNWTEPQRVLTLPDDAGIISVWAPEMHAYKGKYYIFVTLTFKDTLPGKKPVKSANWPKMHVRGTHVFHSDSPLGPFHPFKVTSFTPENWMALDGSLFVEDHKPYMVFCHEWVQTVDGTINYIQLKGDLSDTVGKPQFMFSASDAPGAIRSPLKGKVTDGCFLYRSEKSGRLYMIWSTFIPEKGYCVLCTHSETGKIIGPWKGQTVIYKKNGGHGMLFKSFGGQLVLALHQPNDSPEERLHLFQISDDGVGLEISREYFME